MPKIISIVGKSETGKTTLIERLIPVLKKRGFRVGVIKHASHGFDIDQEGKDSWRHQQAGADTVVVASDDQFAMAKKQNPVSLESLLKYFADIDLLITEGYKRENQLKIEVFRALRHSEPFCSQDPNLIAFVTDTDMGIDKPAFAHNEIEKLADFIEKRLF